MKTRIVKCGENPDDYTVEQVGGKGINLLRLYNASKELNSFNVPEFFIIPTDIEAIMVAGYEGNKMLYKDSEIKRAFEDFNKPVAIRSSSPLEDGINASFAGMFCSFLNQETYDDLETSSFYIVHFAYSREVEKYAERMGIEWSCPMAIIVQEQVVNPWLKGVIQLDEGFYGDASFRCEFTDRESKEENYDLRYDYLEAIGKKIIHKPREDAKYINESDFWALGQCAIDVRKALGLEGVVQVEACFSPDKVIDLVQIRQLPKIKSHFEQLDLTIPEGTPYIESEICNGLSGELTLPAYVTTSQSGLSKILIETGQSFFLGIASGDLDERFEKFSAESKLAKNYDFIRFRDSEMNRIFAPEITFNLYNKAWKKGNSLFDDYILVCDKLDESVLDMSGLTTNKRAIITCLEARKTSHAMTVARDLGIMAMGTNEDLYEYDSFFHNIETGDIVHMKSNGKKAVAYVEKKRDKDPYN